jgi:glucose/arabinose dehydrogenase
MSPGPHSLALAAYREALDGSRIEGVRSAELMVFVVGPAQSAVAQEAQTSIRTLDGVDLRVTRVAEGLSDPTDLAFAPDGRLFVAERSGWIRLIDRGRVASLGPLPDIVATTRHGLLSLAADPEFARTPFLYALYTSAAGYRLTRFRVANDRLLEPRIVLDGVDPSPARPAAVVRFGPDRRLYLAFDDGGDPVRPGDLGSFNGKVLRLNPDGTTPADQAGGTPVHALNVTAPTGLTWDGGELLWIADAATADGSANGLLQLVDAPAPGARRGVILARYALPPGAVPADAVFYRSRLLPAFRDDLFVATPEGLLRLRVDPGNGRTIAAAERLLRRRASGARALGVGPDGAIYFLTPDAVHRLAPHDGA